MVGYKRLGQLLLMINGASSRPILQILCAHLFPNAFVPPSLKASDGRLVIYEPLRSKNNKIFVKVLHN